MKKYMWFGFALVVVLLGGATSWAEPEPEPEAPESLVGSCATFHEHINYGGAELNVNTGDVISYMGDFWNDRVSSIWVRPGCTLYVWEHIDYTGAYSWFNSNVPWIGDAWNDRISSYSCYCS